MELVTRRYKKYGSPGIDIDDPVEVLKVLTLMLDDISRRSRYFWTEGVSLVVINGQAKYNLQDSGVFGYRMIAVRYIYVNGVPLMNYDYTPGLITKADWFRVEGLLGGVGTGATYRAWMSKDDTLTLWPTPSATDAAKIWTVDGPILHPQPGLMASALNFNVELLDLLADHMTYFLMKDTVVGSNEADLKALNMETSGRIQAMRQAANINRPMITTKLGGGYYHRR